MAIAVWFALVWFKHFLKSFHHLVDVIELLIIHMIICELISVFMIVATFRTTLLNVYSFDEIEKFTRNYYLLIVLIVSFHCRNRCVYASWNRHD